MDARKTGHIHTLYLRAIAICQRTLDADKKYVAIQETKGGCRLVLGNNGITSYRFVGMDAQGWAENVLSLMAQHGLLGDIDEDDVAEYVKELHND